MTMRDDVYLLVLDEVACQPGLADEIQLASRLADLTRAHGPAAADVVGVVVGSALGGIGGALAGPAAHGASAIVAALGPRPETLARHASNMTAWVFGQEHNAYESLCRSALVHLLWNDLAAAERDINIAKNRRDDWAFAHHVYGLLRGVQENPDGARFELRLALDREELPSVRGRIQRALDLLP